MTRLNSTHIPFALHRLRVVMEPDSANPHEAWGVLNPAACRARDGTLYLYPRIVAEGNLSRIGLARVRFENDEPVGVERLGYALEPTEGYERNERTRGCEDARVTFVPALDRFVMTYTAYGPLGPRVALAVSEDARAWQRIGLAKLGMCRSMRPTLTCTPTKTLFCFPSRCAIRMGGWHSH